MEAAGWIAVVQIIPTEYHDGLTLMMQNGLEINLQSILRLEEEFLVCRGRTMGSTDAGLIFFIPYDQINCLGYSKLVKEPVVHSWFAEGPAHPLQIGMAPPEMQPEPAAEETMAEEAPREEAPAPPPPAAAPVRPAAPAARPAAGPPLIRPPARPATPSGNMPITTGLALPAKAAMIERLRKRNPGGPAKPPEQK
jgi:hypothetical protein